MLSISSRIVLISERIISEISPLRVSICCSTEPCSRGEVCGFIVEGILLPRFVVVWVWRVLSFGMVVRCIIWESDTDVVGSTGVDDATVFGI